MMPSQRYVGMQPILLLTTTCQHASVDTHVWFRSSPGSHDKKPHASALSGQGRRNEVLIGGGRVYGFRYVQTNISPKFSFYSDFGHFIWKYLKMQNFNRYVSRKGSGIFKFLRGHPPLIRQRGRIPLHSSPPPPRFRHPCSQVVSAFNGT